MLDNLRLRNWLSLFLIMPLAALLLPLMALFALVFYIFGCFFAITLWLKGLKARKTPQNWNGLQKPHFPEITTFARHFNEDAKQ